MSDQFNISGFPKLLRLKLAHLAIDAGKKLNQYIIHVCWEHVREKEKRADLQAFGVKEDK